MSKQVLERSRASRLGAVCLRYITGAYKTAGDWCSWCSHLPLMGWMLQARSGCHCVHSMHGANMGGGTGIIQENEQTSMPLSPFFTPLVDHASNAASLRYHTGDLSCNPPANSQMVTGYSGSCSHSHHYTSRAHAAGLFYVDILASQVLTPRCLARSALLSNCGHHSHGPYACSVTDAQSDKALQCLLLKCQAKVLPHTW